MNVTIHIFVKDVNLVTEALRRFNRSLRSNWRNFTSCKNYCNSKLESLEKRLNEVQDEIEFKPYLGLKHIEPFVEDAVEAMHKDGIKEAVSIVLAPHYSTFSVKSYNGRAKETAEKLGGLNNSFSRKLV